MTELVREGASGGVLPLLPQVVEGIPVPALGLVHEGRRWWVNAANTAFVKAFALEVRAEGAALADLVPDDGRVVIEGPPLGDVLAQVRRTGEQATARMLLDPPGRQHGISAGERTRWTLRLQPLGDPPEAVLVTLLDLSGQLLDSAAREETAALQHLTAGLTLAKPLPEVYVDVIRGAALAAGAARGAILLSQGGATFETAATTPGAELPERIVVEDLSSPIWQACLGRERIAWDAEAPASGPPPLPFAGQEGWERLLVTGLRLHGRWQGVLVVAGPRLGEFDADAPDRLELVATLAATAVDNARLVEEFERLEELLAAAVETSASLVETTDPKAVRQRLLDGLVEEMGLAGAALWSDDGQPEDGLRLLCSAGLPEDVREAVATLDHTSMAVKLARGPLSGRLQPGATATAASSWPGHRLRLVHVPPPSRGILGVYVRDPLPELVDGVLATLAHALAAAVHQATLHERARTVVDSLQRELRPRDLALPSGAEIGSVYRSATSGVDVGGDFYDWFLTGDEGIGLACGDVAGKGVEAASLTAMAVYSLRAFALPGRAPRAVLFMLNAAVAQQIPAERFITLAYAWIDPHSWGFRLAVAGHPPPIVAGPDQASVLATARDVPLGIDAQAGYEDAASTLEPGQALVLYTDGVTEARSADGELLGVERVLEVLAERAATPGCTAQRLAESVWDLVHDWTDDGTTDDCAIVVLRREPS